MTELLDTILNALETNTTLRYALTAVGVLISSLLAYALAKRGVLRLIEFVVRKSATEWDDMLLKRGVFSRVAWLAPGIVLYYAAFQFDGQTEPIIQRLIIAYMQIVVIGVMTSFLSAVGDIWQTTKRSKRLPIKGYVQVTKLLVFLLGGVIVVATVVDKSPWGILSGIGAATAVFLLVFKDTILSFVAGIQIASTGVIRLGDWISMPKYNADGTVTDIALHRVTIQNWDKTLTAIPTYKFIEESFTNWRGMEESGGRRIKRSITFDQTSVHFLTEHEIERLSGIHLLESYLGERSSEVDVHNKERSVDEAVLMNGRRLTNLGTFRAYLVRYLKEHPKIHSEMTFLVRQLAPGADGIAIEVYVFSNDIDWANYEAIQSDIFDHILAALPQFGLRVFQHPTGADFRAIAPL
jgi:miniconductance mechanosensitive channel